MAEGQQGTVAQKDNDGDIPMNDTKGKMREDSTSGSQKSNKYTLSQREATTRIQNLSDRDYYGILGLSEICSFTEIRKAYRKLSKLTHPDQNKFEDAEIAFKKLGQAYAVLSNLEERAKYNKHRNLYQAKGELDPHEVFGEEFAENASGDESSEFDSTDDSDNNADAEDRPDQKILDIYEKSAKHVNEYLTAVDGLSSESAKAEIHRANRKIKKANREVKRPDETYAINIGLLSGFRIEYINSCRALEKNPACTRTTDDFQRIQKQFTSIRKGYHYPASWKLPMVPCAGSEVLDQKIKKANEQKKILGYRPHRNIHDTVFIVENKGSPNQIAVEREDGVGRDAAQAYLALPDSEKKDIRYSQDKYGRAQRDSYDCILGWDHRFPAQPSAWSLESRKSLPPSYGLVRFRNGATDILNRTALRKLLGCKRADREIEKFYQQRNLALPSARTPIPSRLQETSDFGESGNIMMAMLEKNQRQMQVMTDALVQLTSRLAITQ